MSESGKSADAGAPGVSSLPGPDPDRSAVLVQRMSHYVDKARRTLPPLRVEGVLRRSVGLTLEAEGCHAPVGGRCEIIAGDGRRVEAEVVGFAGERLFLMPTDDMRGVVPNSRVVPKEGVPDVAVGKDLLGHVLDGRGRPLDNAPIPHCVDSMPLFGEPINPLQRHPIDTPLDVGIRSINALLPVGRGQRMGLFAGSGVGKSMLLGMMTRNTDADVVVVGLIGERGREVKEFIESTLGEEGMKRAVVVATPADDTPLMRLHGAWLSATIAEYFRAQGKHVLLLMDSLTRFAQAQREIALAIGEPPATKGYPPSVFAKLPQLVERAGNGSTSNGSITAFYTILAEGDDPNDPIVDASRAILDGHIVLSRQLADAGVYPAIDIEASISRAMTQVTSVEHRELISHFRQIHATYQEHRDLIAVGAYQRGSDPRVDDALARWPSLIEFMRQELSSTVTRKESIDTLRLLLSTPATPVADAPVGDS